MSGNVPMLPYLTGGNVRRISPGRWRTAPAGRLDESAPVAGPPAGPGRMMELWLIGPDRPEPVSRLAESGPAGLAVNCWARARFITGRSPLPLARNRTRARVARGSSKAGFVTAHARAAGGARPAGGGPCLHASVWRISAVISAITAAETDSSAVTSPVGGGWAARPFRLGQPPPHLEAPRRPAAGAM